MKSSEPLKAQRKVFCANTRQCLSRAIEHEWRGFSCAECDAYVDERESWEPAWVKVDALRCADVLCDVIKAERRFEEYWKRQERLQLRRQERQARDQQLAAQADRLGAALP